MKEPAATNDIFAAMVKKPHTLLSKEERRILGLQHTYEQAQLELRNATTAAQNATERVKEIEARVQAAKAAVDAALAGMVK
jgi:hypothetical protein